MLSPNIINGWLEVNRDYTNLTAIDHLFNELSIEYNNNILNEYHVITGLELPQLVD